MQGHTRNPLADPGLLGVTAGATFAVVFAIYVVGVTDLTGYAWFAMGGAGLATVAVFAIGSTRGGPDPVSLVLAGAAVSALLLALAQGMVLQDLSTLDEYRFWAVGSTAGRDMEVLYQVLPFIARRPAARGRRRTGAQPAPARRRRRPLARHEPARPQDRRHRSPSCC